MPTTTSPWSAYRACISFSQGKERRQGTHHDAQKSTTTTCPLKLPRLRNGSAARTGIPDIVISTRARSAFFTTCCMLLSYLNRCIRWKYIVRRRVCGNQSRDFHGLGDGATLPSIADLSCVFYRGAL